MEPEANLTQDVNAIQDVETPEETPASSEENAATDTVVTVENDVQPAEAAEQPAEADAEQPADAAEQPAEATVDVVATEDVSHARTSIELAKIAKESLIERAKQLADSTDWRKTTEAQRELMDEWRKVGFAGKDDQDRLWEEFRAARQEFFTRRETEVVKIKQEIIEEAREATKEVTNWKETGSKLDALMDRWKVAGNSGSELDQKLWNEFNSIRRDFRNRRKADMDQRRAKARENAEQKREIAQKAQEIADSQVYSRENSKLMQELDREYKKIGFAGRPANDEIWALFSAAKQSYWNGNNAYLEEQRRRQNERLQEVVERKNDQINHLKTQNDTLTARLGSTIDPEKIEKIKRWIAQNDERAADLKEDVDDIKKRI